MENSYHGHSNHGKNSLFRVQQFSLQTIYNHVVLNYKVFKRPLVAVWPS